MSYESESEDEMILRVLERTARAAEAAAEDRAEAAARPAPRRRRAAPDLPVPEDDRARRAARRPAQDERRAPRDPAAPRKVRVLPGFCGKARVMTTFGALPIEALRKRDELRTSTGRPMRVMAIDKILLDTDFLSHHPEAAPIRVRAGSLGRGLPQRDIVMSPRQKIVPTTIASASSAKTVEDMRGLPGILPMPPDQTVYYRFHVGEPAMVQVEGMWMLIEP